MPADPDPTAIEDPADLYTLPLDQFTAARDGLAKQLADDDRDDEAATVRKLKKPSVAAWALNRAARGYPDAVEKLLASHRDLRAADTAELLSSASDQRRKAVAELEAIAVAELEADGRSVSGPTRDRIRSTLLAVATDHEGEDDLAAGRLVRELEPTGAGWGEIGLTPRVDDRPDVRAKAAAEKARARATKLREQAESARQQVESAERALREAKRRAEDAEVRAKEAEAEAKEAETSAKD